MTVQNWTGNFNKFGSFFLYKLTKLRPMIILNGIFALLSYPFAFIALNGFTSADIAEKQAYDAGLIAHRGSPEVDLWEQIFISSIFIGIACLIAMFVMSYVFISNSFRWLYKKNYVDMDYSLPVSEDTRFFGSLAAAFAGMLVPHLISLLTGLAIFSGTVSMCDASGIYSVNMGEYIAVISQCMWTGFFACVMFAVLTLFMLSLIGRTAESKLYPLAMLVAIPIIHAVCVNLSYEGMHGFVSFQSSSLYPEGIAVTSPFGLLLSTFMTLGNTSGAYSELAPADFTMPLFKFNVFIPAVILLLVMLAASWLLIRLRRAERVGSPFVFKAMKFVIPAVIIFTIVVSVGYSVIPNLFPQYVYDNYYSYDGTLAAVISTVIGTFILYVIMELISGNGFKKFHITLAKYAATFCGSALIAVIIFFAGVWGIHDTVPAESNISTAGFEMELRENGERFRDCYGKVSEEANIKVLTELQREIYSKPRINKGSENHYTTVSVYYILNDGTTTIYKQFCIDKETYDKYKYSIVTPEVYINEMENDLRSADRIKEVRAGYNAQNVINVDIPAEQFLEAYRNDCQQVNYDLLLQYANTDNYSLFVEYTQKGEYDVNNVVPTGGASFALYPWCTETIELISQSAGRDINASDLATYPKLLSSD